MNLTLLASLISAACAGAAGFAIAWQIQAGVISDNLLEQANERIAIQRQSRAAFERYSATVATAQAEAASRAAVLARERDDTRSALERLRNTSTATVRAVADSPASCSAAVSTYDLIHAECASRLGEVAEVADRAISDNQALIQSWPKR